MNSDFFKLAVSNLRRRGVRSWLTIIGIVISIAVLFVLVSISIGLEGAVKEQFRLLGTDKFFVQPRGQLGAPGSGGAVELTIKDVEVLDKINGVKGTSYATITSAEISLGDQKRFVNVVGLPLDRIDLFRETQLYKEDEGVFLKRGDKGEVMVGSQYKYNNVFRRPLRVGDRIEINGVSFKVGAILKSLGNPGDDRTIYMSTDDLKELFNVGDRVDQIAVQIEQGQDIQVVADAAKRKLLNARGLTEKTQDFTILTPEELLSSFETVLNIITGFLLGIAAISLIVGGIGITNTMYTSVLERTKEIGVMKAIGAKNRDIMLLFLIESGLLGLVGGVVGVALGFGISQGIAWIATYQLGTSILQAATPFWLVFGSLVFSFSIGAISGMIPAFNASKLKIVDAIRYE